MRVWCALKILFIGAHPDDPVWYVGGTIANFSAQNHKVVLAVMSSNLGAVDKARLEELNRAANVFACARDKTCESRSPASKSLGAQQ